MARPSNETETGKAVLELLDKFVCVRMVYANGTDLTMFQFDNDLTFAAFFLNADRKIYGRYGTLPSPRSGIAGVSQRGFIAAMQGALELHRAYPANEASLADKRGPKSPVAVPEDFDDLVEYQNRIEWSTRAVARSCMHCHQIGSARFQHYRYRKQPVPENVLFPWPMPSALGLVLDIDRAAHVQRVDENSIGKRAGLEPGDDILELAGQPILSIADVQWVLHTASDPCRIAAVVRRGDRRVEVELDLPQGFRRPRDGIPFRWTDRHLSLGRVSGLGIGIRLRDLNDEERRAAGIAKDRLALVETRGGGRRFGRGSLTLEPDDTVVEIDGLDDRMSESDVYAHCLQKHVPGDVVKLTVMREGKRVELRATLR
ncbi:MAG: hypothetical protein KDC95_13055 [Planctomycetes bacterium]|nr:hypothetical protein [Planctomycetota bacterium]